MLSGRVGFLVYSPRMDLPHWVTDLVLALILVFLGNQLHKIAENLEAERAERKRLLEAILVQVSRIHECLNDAGLSADHYINGLIEKSKARIKTDTASKS